MNKVDRQLEEAWKHCNNYLSEYPELKKLCKNCESHTGRGHDYTKCRNKTCFKCFLALVYLKWGATYD